VASRIARDHFVPEEASVKQFFLTIAGVFAGLLLFFVFIPIMLIASAAGSSAPATPSNSVLVVDLRETLTDVPANTPFAAFTAGSSVTGLVRKLEAAETDRNVKGLFIRASEAGMAPAHAEEIRQALIDFKASGKFVIAHAQGFESPTLSTYVSVSAANELWLQGSTNFSATGLVAETTFLGGMFQKFGITPEFAQFYEYKNAVDTYTQRDYNTPHRESTTAMIGSIYNSFVAAAAFDRKLPVETVKAALDRAPLPAAAAIAAKLVDKIGQPEEAMDAALEKAGGIKKAHAVDISSYTPSPTNGPVVALIGGEGAIVTGPDGTDPFANEADMKSDAFAQAIRDATDDDAVKAIVFRVSSPGGSPTASDQIWAAIERAKKAKKPVVVSMGAYAASGGYYISTGADAIVAMPSTITGSIGVFGGKFVINDALNRYAGANISDIPVGGPYASTYSPATRFSNEQRAAFTASLTRVYEDFTGKVAAGRKLPLARVQEIAKGRVWTGNQAKELGLVDQIGGLRTAIGKAKSLAGIEASDSITIKTFPQMDDPLTALGQSLGASAQSARTTARAAAVIGAVLGDERVASLLAQTRAGSHAQMSEPVRVK
jgi:protease IV